MNKQQQRNKIAKTLRDLRFKSGLSQQGLALKIGVTRSSYGAYEEGRAFPSIQVLRKLTIFYNFSSIEAMLNEEEPLKKVEEEILYCRYMLLNDRDKKIVDLLLGISK
jgi:transcriptional regulator with XRE-family HTH domain